jgi:hypothetical protein
VSIIVALLAFFQARAFIRKSDAAWAADEKETAWLWLAAGLAALIVEMIALVCL